MWIARDKDGSLWLFDSKPIRGKDVWLCDDTNNPDGFINIDDFQSPEGEVTWENSPLELTIKTKVMKPFNLDEAKAGKPICTRDGKPARIISYDCKGNYPIVVLVTGRFSELGVMEMPFLYTLDGKPFSHNTNYDLFMGDDDE